MIFAFDQDHTFQYGAPEPLGPAFDVASVLHDDTPARDAPSSVRLTRQVARSPPVRVLLQPSHRQSSADTTIHAAALGDKLDFEKAKSNASKRKKKRAKKPTPAPPADQTIRGFQTPILSECDETDISSINTPAFGPVRSRDTLSILGSPALHPTLVSSGISSLKGQLDELDLRATMSGSAVSNGVASGSPSAISDLASTSERNTMYTYRVDIDEASTSAEAVDDLHADPADIRPDSSTRKMTADDFEPLCCLGKGSYGTVILVKNKATGRLFAQKQLRKASLIVHKKRVEQTKTERAILENVNRHPFVVKLYYAFQDQEKLYLILEYAQGGELFHHLAMERMFPEEVAAFYMAEMVLALEHLHRDMGIVYRDLKPENCLLDSEGHLLLTDFGLSKVAVDQNDTCNSILGTAEYMAPEIIQGKDYSFAVDWWSLGALGFDLLTGSPPFAANNRTAVHQKIVHQKLHLPYFLSPDAKDILTRLLRKEPSKRLGSNLSKDLHTIRTHRFFRNIDWGKLAKRELEAPIQPLITDPQLAENFSNEFTDLDLSPILSPHWRPVMAAGGEVVDGAHPLSLAETELFGGFSFVASSSLLEYGNWPC